MEYKVQRQRGTKVQSKIQGKEAIGREEILIHLEF